MLSPTISAYKADDIGSKQVTVRIFALIPWSAADSSQAVLIKYPAWGYTTALKADGVKSKIVNRAIQKNLTELRCDVKRLVSASSVLLPS